MKSMSLHSGSTTPIPSVYTNGSSGADADAAISSSNTTRTKTIQSSSSAILYDTSMANAAWDAQGRIQYNDWGHFVDFIEP
jgi:hypothetical protein